MVKKLHKKGKLLVIIKGCLIKHIADLGGWTVLRRWLQNCMDSVMSYGCYPMAVSHEQTFCTNLQSEVVKVDLPEMK